MLTINPKPAGSDSDGKAKPPSQFEKWCGAAVHLAGVFWLPVMPMQVLALIVPFLALQFARVHSDYVEQHAVQACNFQMLIACFYALAMVATMTFKTPLFIWWIGAGALLFSLWQAAKALNGWQSKYPFSIKLFK